MNKKLILKASFKILSKTGLEGFSMRELARQLKCQPSSIYHYYATKNDILNDLYMEMYNLFFLELVENEDDLSSFLFKLCTTVQKNRAKYLFLVKYRHSNFLSKDNICLIVQNKVKLEKIIENFFQDKKLSIIDFILINGPITELAFLEKVELNEQELLQLVNRMINAIKEYENETIN